jgi:formamidopyrimidine-DNA glycosylase
MPELPDITIYVEALERRVLGRRLVKATIAGPFLLRTERGVQACEGQVVGEVRRVGKRVALGFEGAPWLVLHLMIAGRLHWSGKAKVPDGRRTLAAFTFESGCLTLTEAGSQKRAALHVVDDPMMLDAGGVDVMASDVATFVRVLGQGNHTLKRALTDPHWFSGIGNAYSDEILHRARLSPILLTSRINEDEIARLHQAVRVVMTEWIERLRAEAGDGFPEKVTVFRKEMAVHGRYGLPCPVCGSKVQRIRYAANETNYCARCQTGDRVLADRALSRLLREDWPRSLDDLEEFERSRRR